MPLFPFENNKLGRTILVDGDTGKIVDHVEIRDGILHYMAADGDTLESKVIGTPHHFVCTAVCGERCEAGNLTGNLPDCHKGYPDPNWKESAD